MSQRFLGRQSMEKDAAILKRLIGVTATAAAGGASDHGGLTGLTDDDHSQYVHISAARTITTQHTFNPMGAPFLVGGSALDVLVTGLNADLLDGQHASEFASSADFQTLAGDGLAWDAGNAEIDVGAGDGITVNATTIEVNASALAGAGITVTSNNLGLTTPGTLSVSTVNTASGNHLHTITSSSAPGAAASLLASASDGGITLDHLDIGSATGATAGQIKTSDNITIADGKRFAWDANSVYFEKTAAFRVGLLNASFRIDSDANFEIGSDIVLERYSANVLKTEDSLRLGGSIFFEDTNDYLGDTAAVSRYYPDYSGLLVLDNLTSDTVPSDDGILISHTDVIAFSDVVGDLIGWVDVPNAELFWASKLSVGAGSFGAAGTALNVFGTTAPQARIAYDGSNYADIQVSTGGDLELLPTGNVIVHPTTAVLPTGTLEKDLGAFNRKFRTLYVGELIADYLTIQSIYATEGGRILVAPTTRLYQDIDTTQAYATFEHDIFDVNDWTYSSKEVAGAPQFEVMQIGAQLDSAPYTGRAGDAEHIVGQPVVKVDTTYIIAKIGDSVTVAGSSTRNGTYEVTDVSLVSPDTVWIDDGGAWGGSGSESCTVSFTPSSQTGTAYLHAVTRNEDGSGGNNWVAGDTVANLNSELDTGYIDITATESVHNQDGPLITVFTRTGTGAWNQTDPVVALGNLADYLDYSGVGKFGMIVGNDAELTPTTGFKGLSSDRTNGFRLFSADIKTYDGSTLTGEWTSAGDLKLGSNVAANATTSLDFDGGAGTIRVGFLSANKGNMYFDGTDFSLRSNTSPKIILQGDGDVFIGDDPTDSTQTILALLTNAQVYGGYTMAAGDFVVGQSDDVNFRRIRPPTSSIDSIAVGNGFDYRLFFDEKSHLRASLDIEAVTNSAALHLGYRGLWFETGEGSQHRVNWGTSPNHDHTNSATDSLWGYMSGADGGLTILATTENTAGFGTVSITGAGTGGVIDLGADEITIDGDDFIHLDSPIVRVNQYLEHAGDTNTEIEFLPDHLKFRVGGIEMLQLVEGANDYVRVDDKLYINTGTANTFQDVGLTIHEDSAATEMIALKGTPVAHGMTDITETDTLAALRINSAASGGLVIRGFTETTLALHLAGYSTTGNTAKSTSAQAAVRVSHFQKSGTGKGNVTSDSNSFIVRTEKGGAVTTIFIVDEDGDVWTESGGAVHDEYDDLALLRASQVLRNPKGLVKTAYDDFVKGYESQLEDLGIMRFNRDSDEVPFTNRSKMQDLIVGGFYQLAQRVMALEAQLNQTGGH